MFILFATIILPPICRCLTREYFRCRQVRARVSACESESDGRAYAAGFTRASARYKDDCAMRMSPMPYGER